MAHKSKVMSPNKNHDLELTSRNISLDKVTGSQGHEGKKKNMVQYSTKERSQCLEGDRFLMTKKIRVENLPKGMGSGALCKEQ